MRLRHNHRNGSTPRTKSAVAVPAAPPSPMNWRPQSADGVQIDVSEVVREAGLKFPVYLIHSKAVRESETRGNPSTLGAEIEGQIRVLTAQSGPSDTEAPMS